jgi:hypothetical protein
MTSPRQLVGTINSVQNAEQARTLDARMEDPSTGAVYEVRLSEMQVVPSQRSRIAEGERVICTFRDGEGPEDGVEAIIRSRVRVGEGVAREDLFAAIDRARVSVARKRES